MAVQLLPFQKLVDIPDAARPDVRRAICTLAITSIVLISLILGLLVMAFISSEQISLYSSNTLFVFFVVPLTVILLIVVLTSNCISLRNTDIWAPTDVCCNIMRSHPTCCTKSCAGNNCCCARLSCLHTTMSVWASVFCVLLVVLLVAGCNESSKQYGYQSGYQSGIGGTCVSAERRRVVSTKVFSPKSKAELVDAIVECSRLSTDCSTGPNGPIGEWDVSDVTDMSRVFFFGVFPNVRYLFNGDISKWDVSHVTDMSFMFYSAYLFNGDISKWDVSSVTYMEGMFNEANAFNGDISKWDVSSVINMKHMFDSANSFSHTLCDKWQTSLANKDEMFFGSRGKMCRAQTDFSTATTRPTDPCRLLARNECVERSACEWANYDHRPNYQDDSPPHHYSDSRSKYSCELLSGFEVPALILMLCLVATSARSAWLLRKTEQGQPEIAPQSAGKMVVLTFGNDKIYRKLRVI